MRILACILLVLLVLTNALWIYQFYDRSITLDHARISQEHSRDDLRALIALCERLGGGSEYESVARKVGEIFDRNSLKMRKNAIFLESIVLIFENGRLLHVKALNDLSSEEFDFLDQ